LYQSRLDEIRSATARRTLAAVEHEFDDSTQAMSGALEVIVRDESLRKALAARDADALYREAKPPFDRLHRQIEVDHFYFHAPDRTCLLRVPDRGHRGD